MDYGVAMFPTDYAVGPGEFARMAEERGFESVFFPEHTHIPVSRETPYPSGGELPPEYSHTHDLFVALAAAAGATARIKIGSGICLVVERDPITTAKEVSSIDVLSGGRFIFGIGAGWNREEMRNHGTDPSKRFRLMRERVEAMKTLWTEEEAEYHGELVDFDPVWQWPKPVQKPHPPVMIGGMGERVVDRVVAYGDGWFPQPGRMPDDDSFVERVARHRGEFEMTAFGAKRDPAVIERYEEAGVSRTVFWVPPRGRDDVEQFLDGLPKG